MKAFRWLLKVIAGLIALLVFIAAGLWLFLPDRYVVNTPVMALFETQPVDRQALNRQLQLPPGFSLSLYATGLDGIRVLRASANGNLVVSTPRTGKVWLVSKDSNGGLAEKQLLLENLNRPHGIELHDGWLYVAETNAVGRVPFDTETGAISGEYTHIITDIPESGMHWTRTLRRGPDGWFYLTVGSNCNACEDIPLRAAMHRFKADGSEFETFATGLRNSVDFGWAPWNNQLYATDNGRDLLGDDLPPCELNQVVKDGFYGWPYSWGNRQPDPDLGADHMVRVTGSTGPAHSFKAHTAPLGIAFLDATDLPDQFKHSALVAQHGSWNRTRKAGYRLVSLHWDDKGTITERDFLTGFEVDETVIGRPAFVEQGPDGAVYISDDFNGSIYRVSYGEDSIPLNKLPIADNTNRAKQSATNIATEIPATELAAKIASGQQLYQQHNCASCHAVNLASSTMVAKPLASLSAHYSRQSLNDFLQTPTPPMPVFPLSDEQRDALAVYLLVEKAK